MTGRSALRAIATLGDQSHDRKSDSVDNSGLREAATRRGTRGTRGHGLIDATPSFPDADRDEPSSVSETTSLPSRAGGRMLMMVSTRLVRPSRSDTKAPGNSIANTAVSSVNHPCATFEHTLLRPHRIPHWSAVFDSRMLLNHLQLTNNSAKGA